METRDGRGGRKRGCSKGVPPTSFGRSLPKKWRRGRESDLAFRQRAKNFLPPLSDQSFFLGRRGRMVLLLLLFSGYEKDKSLILLPGNMSLLKTREHTQSIGRAKKRWGTRSASPGGARRKTGKYERKKCQHLRSRPPGKENHLAPAPRTHLQIHTS